MVWTVPDDRDARSCSGRAIRATFDEDVPLDRTRLMLAVFALVMFVALLHAGADSSRSELIGRMRSQIRLDDRQILNLIRI